MHNLFLVYFVKLYMFRAYLGPSSGGTAVCIQQMVLIIFLDDCLLSCARGWRNILRISCASSWFFFAQLLYLVRCVLQYRDVHKYYMHHLLCVCRSYRDCCVYRWGYIPTVEAIYLPFRLYTYRSGYIPTVQAIYLPFRLYTYRSGYIPTVQAIYLPFRLYTYCSGYIPTVQAIYLLIRPF